MQMLLCRVKNYVTRATYILTDCLANKPSHPLLSLPSPSRSPRRRRGPPGVPPLAAPVPADAHRGAAKPRAPAYRLAADWSI